MDPVDLIEKRIAALELRVLPKLSPPGQTQQASELLLQAHTMISSALSCREAITTILQRMATINEYLDPQYCDKQMDIQQKYHYLLESYPDIRKTLSLAKQLGSLKVFLNSEKLNNIPVQANNLEKLTIENVRISEESRAVNYDILKALQQYNDIIASIKILFAQMEQSVVNFEASFKPKQVMDE